MPKSLVTRLISPPPKQLPAPLRFLAYAFFPYASIPLLFLAPYFTSPHLHKPVCKAPKNSIPFLSLSPFFGISPVGFLWAPRGERLFFSALSCTTFLQNVKPSFQPPSRDSRRLLRQVNARPLLSNFVWPPLCCAGQSGNVLILRELLLLPPLSHNDRHLSTSDRCRLRYKETSILLAVSCTKVTLLYYKRSPSPNLLPSLLPPLLKKIPSSASGYPLTSVRQF